MSFLVFQSQGLRIFKGDTATVQNYTGQDGELSINTETKAVYVHDGLTAGGTPLTTASEAEMLGMTLGQLANVYLDSQSDKSIVAFNQADNTWRSIEGLKLGELLDMVLSSPNEGDLLSYDSATQKWINVPASTGGDGVTNLTGLDDVNLTSPTNNQVLTYDETAGRWINKDAAAGGGGGGAGLPKIDYGNYAVTMDGQVDDEVSPDGTGYYYSARTSGSQPFFDQKRNMYDYDPDNWDLMMMAWDFNQQKWILIRGGDFMTAATSDDRYYNKNAVYTKTQVDDAIAAAGGGSAGGGGGIPIGSIIAWPFSHTWEHPEGYFACWGFELRQIDYPDLFQAYGYTFCPGVMKDNSWQVMNDWYAIRDFQEAKPESDRMFCIPDLRSKLLMGADADTNYYFNDTLKSGSYFDPQDIPEATTHELSWNETNATPTYEYYHWSSPNALTSPLMPRAKAVAYLCRAF